MESVPLKTQALESVIVMTHTVLELSVSISTTAPTQELTCAPTLAPATTRVAYVIAHIHTMGLIVLCILILFAPTTPTVVKVDTVGVVNAIVMAWVLWRLAKDVKLVLLIALAALTREGAGSAYLKKFTPLAAVSATPAFLWGDIATMWLQVSPLKTILFFYDTNYY